MLALLAAPFANASAAAPVEADQAKFVRLTRQLEREPLNDPDKVARNWLMEWAAKSDDVSFVICEVLGPVPSQDVPHAPELLLQMVFGNGSFQILHPDRKADLFAGQMAGIRSSMAAYASILAQEPQARIPTFDQLLVKERAGDLENYMMPVIADKCGKPSG